MSWTLLGLVGHPDSKYCVIASRERFNHGDSLWRARLRPWEVRSLHCQQPTSNLLLPISTIVSAVAVTVCTNHLAFLNLGKYLRFAVGLAHGGQGSNLLPLNVVEVHHARWVRLTTIGARYSFGIRDEVHQPHAEVVMRCLARFLRMRPGLQVFTHVLTATQYASPYWLAIRLRGVVGFSTAMTTDLQNEYTFHKVIIAKSSPKPTHT